MHPILCQNVTWMASSPVPNRSLWNLINLSPQFAFLSERPLDLPVELSLPYSKAPLVQNSILFLIPPTNYPKDSRTSLLCLTQQRPCFLVPGFYVLDFFCCWGKGKNTLTKATWERNGVFGAQFEGTVHHGENSPVGQLVIVHPQSGSRR